MNLSYWEIKSWLSNIDFTIVGSGIVGLNCALNLKERFPESKILILERGFLPNGASTKNAGFACFGSLSEILADLESHSEAEVLELIEKRILGLQLLRKNLGDENIGYFENGGYEIFREEDKDLFKKCLAGIDKINNLLLPVFGEDVFSLRENNLGFKNIEKCLFFNQFEGQIDTGKMMLSLLKKVREKGVFILNNITVENFSEADGHVNIQTDKFEFNTEKLFLSTNGFASQLGIPEVKPARAQVLITKPIQDLKIKGTFHIEEGFYYFRNIDNRILLGGGRNLDLKAEETTSMEQTKLIQDRLEEILKSIILPDQNIEIEHRWSGIMGVGNQKRPIVKQISENVFCGVRLGGMGIAIGSLIGKELADLE